MRLLNGIQYKKMITNRIMVTSLLIVLQILIFAAAFWYVYQFSLPITIVFHVLTMIYTIYIVNKDDSPSYKIGWIILILSVPPVGAILYMLWGDKRPSKKLRKKLEKSYKILETHMIQKEGIIEDLKKQDERVGTTTSYISNIAKYPLYYNSSSMYYTVGEEMYKAMLEALKSAEKYIFVEFFIVQEGEMWGSILEILVEKAKAGVEVKILYDDMGSVSHLPFGYHKQIEAMHENIKCCIFNPIVPFLAMVMNNRDHRKILVVDGKIGFTGGVNLADEYINKVVRFGHWKDTGLSLEGEAVDSMAMLFLEMWNAISGETLNPTHYKCVKEQENPSLADGFVQPYGDNPLDNEAVSENVYMELIAQAQHSIYIMTPYLILDDNMRSCIELAAKRGVSVTIVTPGIPDKDIVFRLTRLNYISLLLAGVKIYEYTPGFLHAKSIICDEKVGVVGTINFDYRSLFLHFECGVFMYKTKALRQLQADFMHTLRCSKKIELEHMGRTWYQTIFDGVLKVMAPLL